MKTFINCTPHEIKVLCNGTFQTIAPSGIVPRVGIDKEELPPIDGISFHRVSKKPVEGLPAPKEGVLFIVSSMVADACKRPDLIVPGDLIRDDKGAVIGCKGFFVSYH